MFCTRIIHPTQTVIAQSALKKDSNEHNPNQHQTNPFNECFYNIINVDIDLSVFLSKLLNFSLGFANYLLSLRFRCRSKKQRQQTVEKKYVNRHQEAKESLRWLGAYYKSR